MARNDWGWSIYPLVPGPRDRRPRHRGRRRGHPLQGRRPRGGRLHGRQLPALRPVPQGRGAAVPGRHDADLWRPRPHHAGDHPWRLFQARRGAAGVRAARARWARPRPRRPAAVRRHHHLFAAAHLERRPGQPGRRDRPRRARPHGGQAGRRPRRARDRPQPLAATRRPTRWRSAPTGCSSRPTRTRWQRPQSSFDLIIDTVPAKHDITPYMPLLDVDGTLVIVGQLGHARRAVHRAAAAGAAPDRRLADRRHRRDPGDARLLRRARTSCPSAR